VQICANKSRIIPGHPDEQGFDLRLVPEKLSEPFLWSSPRTVFVNSVSDLFQPGVSDAYIEDVVRVMVEANWHTYQVLTKRSKRLRDLLSTKLRFAADHRHIWWGVSVQDKRYGLPRVEHLRAAPAAVKFLSIEPLLEDLGQFEISGIQWAIVGGESGIGERLMQKRWVEDIHKICRRDRIAFFFKQWGGVRKATTGRLLNGRTYDEMPKLHSNPMPLRHERSTAATLWSARSTAGLIRLTHLPLDSAASNRGIASPIPALRMD
jgi:protein gp37